MARFKIALTVLFLMLASVTALAQTASQITATPLTASSPVGPITYDPATHILTISNRVDVSAPMTYCSQYNQYGQCQGTPQTYYHTATGSVSVHNLTKNTYASGYDQKTGAVMDASTSILADPEDDVVVSASQTVYCPALAATIVDINLLSFHYEIATTMAAATGGAPFNCRVIFGTTYCQFNTQPWCTPATTPPDANVLSVQWPLADGPRPFWSVVALCVSPNGHQPWGCSPGIATDAGVSQPLYNCTSNK